MKTFEKTCKACKTVYARPANIRTPFCSEKCAHETRLATQQKARKKRELDGKCLDCNNLVDELETKLCNKCIRRRVEMHHVRSGFKRFYLGAKHSPSRQKWILNDIRYLNPLLSKNWPDVQSWLETNFELYYEKTDSALRNGLDLSDPVVRIEAEQMSTSKTALEDLVIAKIDYERGL